MSTPANNNIYFEVRGHGQVSRDFSVTAISSSIDGAASILYSGGQQFFEGNEGAEVVISNSNNSRIPDGRYILGRIGATSFDITGSNITAGGFAGTYVADAWIDDLYKFCSGPVPSYVYGTKAQARWIKCVADITDEIGQSINSTGGTAKVDGLTIDILKQNRTEIDRLFAYDSDPIFPVGSYITGESIDTSETSIDLFENVAPDNEFISSQATFNSGSVYINNEAIRIRSYNAGTGRLTVQRGTLKTIPQPHINRSTIYRDIQSGLGKYIDVYRYTQQTNYAANPGTNPYDNNLKLYIGHIDEIDIDDAGTLGKISISSAILRSRLQDTNSALTSNAILLRSGDSADRNISDSSDLLSDGIFNRYAPLDRLQRDAHDFNSQVMVNLQEDITEQWEWIKFDKYAMRIARRVLEQDTSDKNNSYYQYGNYNIRSRIFLPGSDETEDASSNDVVLLEPFESFQDQKEYASPIPLAIYSGDNRPTQLGKLLDLNSIIIDPESSIVSVNLAKLILDTEAPEICHVFESQVQPGKWEQIYTNTTGPAVAQKRVQTQVNTSEEFGEFFYRPPIYIGELILQILTSQNGDKANGLYDVLPFGLGLGIPIDDIDLDSFGLCGPCAISLNTVFLEKKDFEKIDKWLDKNILKPFGIILSTSISGKITANSVAIDSRIFVDENNDIQLVDSSRSITDIADSIQKPKLVIDPRNIFSSYSINFKKPLEDYSSADYEQNIKFISGDSFLTTTGGTVFNRSDFYGAINANPIKYDIKYSLYNTSQLIPAIQDIIRLYGSAIPVFEFEYPINSSADYEKISLGSMHIIQFNKGQINFINNAGQTVDAENQTFAFIVNSIKNNIFMNSVKLSGFLISTEKIGSNYVRRIAPSYKVTALTPATTITYDTDYYQDFDRVANLMEVGDRVLLYDKEFTLLSVDGSGNKDSRTITTISQTKIVINSPFTNSAGIPISYQDGLIVMPDGYFLQTDTTKSLLHYQPDRTSAPTLPDMPVLSIGGAFAIKS